MSDINLAELVTGISSGQIVPYLGPGVLVGVKKEADGSAIPADSDSLILAMTGGQPLSPRLMYEFPRAAMHFENKRSRRFVNDFLTGLYGETTWTRSPFHDWLAELAPPYVVDINRDTQLQDSYVDQPHTLIVGISRIAGTAYRFRIYAYDGQTYHEITQEEADPTLPILFKPLGTPRPDPTYIASDADFVDYITELMGGFAIPSFLKSYRRGKQYLLIGLRLNRDTERMVLSDIVYDAAEPKGWALIPEPTPKEKRFLARLGIEIIEADVDALLHAQTFPARAAMDADPQMVGC